jgi:hypothetical protein
MGNLVRWATKTCASDPTAVLATDDPGLVRPVSGRGPSRMGISALLPRRPRALLSAMDPGVSGTNALRSSGIPTQAPGPTGTVPEARPAAPKTEGAACADDRANAREAPAELGETRRDLFTNSAGIARDCPALASGQLTEAGGPTRARRHLLPLTPGGDRVAPRQRPCGISGVVIECHRSSGHWIRVFPRLELPDQTIVQPSSN